MRANVRGNATDAWRLGERQGTSVGEVAYGVFGEGPPVVLVHGTPTRSYLWRNVAPVLAERNSVYVYDLLGFGGGLVREENPCRCGGQIATSERLGVLERGNLKRATHPRRDRRPILADMTIEEAARQLDLAEAIAEVYKTDPEFAAPRRVYEGLRRAAPDLLL